MSSRGILAAIAIAASAMSAASLAGCKKQSCFGAEADCRVSSPCTALAFRCENTALELRRIDAPTDLRPSGRRALAGVGDVVIGNAAMVAVISGLGNQNYLDVGGGALLDLAARGPGVEARDVLGELFQATGILPEDEVKYDRLELIDERPTRVAVQLRGTLYKRGDRPVSTIYEVRPCEPGIRVRTEIVNDSPETQLFALADAFYWSTRSTQPFIPVEGRGFVHPSFDLLSIDNAFTGAPFIAAAAHDDGPTSYAAVACNVDRLTGFHSSVVSSGGLPKTVVRPRDAQVFERFIAVSGRGDIAGAADLAYEVRRQLFGEPHAALRGRVVGNGGPIARERDLAIVVVEKRPGGARRPVTQIEPDADGSFTARVPATGELLLELHRLGRVIGEAPVPAAANGVRDAGDVSIAPRAQLTVGVVDEAGAALDAELYVVPADESVEAATRGTLYGALDPCAPWLGPPQGASPACNRVLVSRAAGPTTFSLPAGRFFVYAYHGPFFTIARAAVDVTEGATPAPITLTLTALPGLAPPGTLSADLHVHGAASFDSSIPDADRVLSFAAAAVDVIVASDHDVVGNYDATIEALGLDDRLSAISAVETTGHVPWMRVPGDSFPRVIGHYNFWPLAYQPGTPRNGAPFDELVEPGELFARVEPLFTGPGIRQLNHPWAAAELGRDLGFPRALKLDLRQPLPVEDDGTAAGVYVRRHGAFGNGDHDTQEVMNGSQNDLFLAYRAFWWWLLDQGIVKTGTANSDSHSLTDNTVGAPRTLVWAGTRAGRTFDVAALNAALKAGRAIGTNGPIIEAELVDGAGAHELGTRPIAPGAGAALSIRVAAAPWVIVDEIRVVVNGAVARVIDGAAIARPPDPFGAAGILRYTGMIPLAELPLGAGDAWIVVEAGARLPLAADLGGGPHNQPDGVPDTTDNNGDGVVDARDIAEGEDVGPLANPTSPPPDDPRVHFFRVVPGGYPLAFTNPFLLDRNGDGRFTGPGVRR
jgi:hypothetical protein